MHHTGILSSPSRGSPARYSLLADNRALTQVLTHSDNTSRLPVDIVRDAVSGGVVCAFADGRNRYEEPVFLPASCDLTALAFLISEGFFAPFLHRAIGDRLDQYTILTESGCFEPLSILVLLFPDCFYDGALHDASLPRALFLSPPGANVSVSGTFGDSTLLTTADVLQLHQLRLRVGVLLLKSVNEILRDAEVWKLKTNRPREMQGLPAEVVVANAVIALFYEVKMLLLCCIVSTEQTYQNGGGPKEISPRSARSCFEDIFSPQELRRIFEERSRPGVDGVLSWYDAMLGNLMSMIPRLNVSLQEHLQEVLNDVLVDGRRVTGTAVQLLHRPHDSTSTNVLRLPFVQPELPHLPLQPGELAMLLPQNSGEVLLCDSVPSALSLLLRRCATVKMSAPELREREAQLATNPWGSLHGSVAQSVQRQVLDPQFIRSAAEKNCCFVIKLVQWLQRATPNEAKDWEQEEGGSHNNIENPHQEDGAVSGEQSVNPLVLSGLSASNRIIDYVVQDFPFGTAVAQLIRELVNNNLLTEVKLHTWIMRSLKDLESKPSATVGCFAALLVFVLLHRRWELPVDVRNATIALCTLNKHQHDCSQLADLLHRSA